MAKRGQPDDPGKTEAEEAGVYGWNAEGVSEALREAGRKAVELSNNPAARALFAAGLAAAAAAIASNKNVRDATRRNIKEAQEATGHAFESVTEKANEIGAVIVNSAVEAVQTLMRTGAGATASADTKPQAAAAPAAAPKPARARKPAAPKAPAAKGKAKAPAKSGTAKASTAKTSTAKTSTPKTSTARTAAAKPKAPAKPRAPRKKAGDTPSA